MWSNVVNELILLNKSGWWPLFMVSCVISDKTMRHNHASHQWHNNRVRISKTFFLLHDTNESKVQRAGSEKKNKKQQKTCPTVIKLEEETETIILNNYLGISPPPLCLLLWVVPTLCCFPFESPILTALPFVQVMLVCAGCGPAGCLPKQLEREREEVLGICDSGGLHNNNTTFDHVSGKRPCVCRHPAEGKNYKSDNRWSELYVNNENWTPEAIFSHQMNDYYSYMWWRNKWEIRLFILKEWHFMGPLKFRAVVFLALRLS